VSGATRYLPAEVARDVARSRARPPRYRLRPALPGDLAVLVRHRLAMFADIHPQPTRLLEAHGRVYRRWARARMRAGELVGFIAETPEGAPVASGCLWFQPSQPRVLLPATTSPYILSMYTSPAHRGRGLATTIVRRLLAVARRHRFARVTLHASDAGRRVYERLGFEPTREMRLWLDRSIARRMGSSPRRP
jgi:GNAT superfamily N-acetyltransferase